MHGRGRVFGRVFGRGRPSSYRALPVTNPRSSRELMRAHASSCELTRAHASSRELMRAHASSSCCCIHAIAAAHSAGEKVEGSSLWASRGRPRSWITCAIRRNQAQSRGNQEAIRGAIRGLQRQSEGPSEANQRPLRGDHLRALEIAISLESVDQTCGERRRGERLHAEAQSRLPSRSRA
jgi:hypothetical protein